VSLSWRLLLLCGAECCCNVCMVEYGLGGKIPED